jgi:Tfp pilus assembly protein PilO
MSMTRRWSLLTAVLIVGILAASWFLLVSPKRSDAAEIRGQAAAQQASNEALVQKLNELKAQSGDLPKQKAQLATMRKQIPDNPALPTLVRDLTAAGKKVGVQVLSIAPGAPTAAVVAAAPVPVATTDTTAADGSATDGTAATTGTPTTPTVVAPAAAPLYVLPLGLTITGSYFEVEQFINRLEGMQRAYLLTAFDLKPLGAATTGNSTAADELTLSLTGQVFLSPNAAATTSTPVAAPVTTPAP